MGVMGNARECFRCNGCEQQRPQKPTAQHIAPVQPPAGLKAPPWRSPHCNLHSSRTYPTTEVDCLSHPHPREEKLVNRNGAVMRGCLECEVANATTHRITGTDLRPRECRKTRVRGGLQSRSLNAVSHEFTRKNEPMCHGTRSF